MINKKTWNFYFVSSIGGGELFNRLIEEEMISEFDSIKYLRQIVGAVQYLHKNMILHLDLKVSINKLF